LGNVFGTLVGGIIFGMLQSLGGLTLGDGYRDLVALVAFLTCCRCAPKSFLGAADDNGFFAGRSPKRLCKPICRRARRSRPDKRAGAD